MARKLILKTQLPPGDACTLTAVLESLHHQYPKTYITDVRTSCDELFIGNPHVTPLKEEEAEMLEMHDTELIMHCNSTNNSFLRGYCFDLGRRLGIPLELITNRPHLYLTQADQVDEPLADFGSPGVTKYWLITSGVEQDCTLKQWPIEFYQAVVDHFRGRIQFVQVGAQEHDHPSLAGAINLVGKTTVRQLVRLVHRADGGVGPTTLIQHLCAGLEKPYIALLGGREPVTLTQYPLQTTFHTLGKLPCCHRKACWKARVVAIHDCSDKDRELCELPVLNMCRPVGHCMAMISPQEVISALEGFIDQKRANVLVLDTPSGARTKDLSPGNATSPKTQKEKKLALVAHSAWGFDTKIVPAWTQRYWMDMTREHFAYHCLPMVLANQSGWFILAPHGAVAEWNGGLSPKDLKVEATGNPSIVQAMSQVGSGILTWTLSYVFRTPRGWNLLCRGPANYVKDGLCPLEGLVETDWAVASFSMNWKFTRPGRCTFAAGEPIAMLVPHRRFDLEQFSPQLAALDENPGLREGYDVWIRSRHAFWKLQQRGDPGALRQKFQKHYFRGTTNQGVSFLEHQKARRLAPFATKPAPPPESK
jgi:ADP-heptose:LPS heptosyltransferase